MRGAEFDGAVAFSRAGAQGLGRAGPCYEEAAGLVTLTGDPRIVDEGEGSELRGRRIGLGTRSRGVTASENVRHTVARGGRRARRGMLGGEEPAVLAVPRVRLRRRRRGRPATGRTRCCARAGTRSARRRSSLEEQARGAPAAHRERGHVSVLHPRPEKGAAKEPAAVEARSREMVYEEAREPDRLHRGREIRQGDIRPGARRRPSRSPKDGGDGRTLVAGEPVEVQQGERRATGAARRPTPRPTRRWCWWGRRSSCRTPTGGSRAAS